MSLQELLQKALVEARKYEDYKLTEPIVQALRALDKFEKEALAKMANESQKLGLYEDFDTGD